MKDYKKMAKYGLLVVLLALAGYHSVYFEKLDQRKADAPADFDAEAYARGYLEEKLPPALEEAVPLGELLALLKSDKETAFEQYSHALGIGNIRFFLVRGEGVIDAVEKDQVLVDIPEGTARIATEYVFGNAVRDASGLIEMDEFDNTVELNDVSAAVNRLIREEVLPPFKEQAAAGRKVSFTGALELNRAYPDLARAEIIPITLNLIE